MNPHTSVSQVDEGCGDDYKFSCYFGLAFSHPKEAVEVICHELRNPRFGRIDCIVGTGVSGVILLSSISVASGIPCFVVRKISDAKFSHDQGGSHSRRRIEPRRPENNGQLRYVIIDDLVSTGDTVRGIIHTMTKEISGSECAGIVTYEQDYHPSITCGDLPPTSITMDDIKEVARLRAEEGYGDNWYV